MGEEGLRAHRKRNESLRARDKRHRNRERTLKPKDPLEGKENRVVKGVGSGIRPLVFEYWHLQLASTLCFNV